MIPQSFAGTVDPLHPTEISLERRLQLKKKIVYLTKWCSIVVDDMEYGIAKCNYIYTMIITTINHHSFNTSYLPSCHQIINHNT
jgi:hypothetical protein